jgi:hypothetical protein
MPTDDGTPEIAIADASNSRIFVKVGLAGAVAVLGPEQGINKPQSVVLADLNGDHILDLIVANTGANNVLVFPGLPGGQFAAPVNGPGGIVVGQGPVSVSVASSAVPGPGPVDLIVADSDSHDVTILRGLADTLTWTPTSSQTIDTGVGSAPVKALVTTDVTNDGHADLLVCDSGTNQVAIYPGQPDGSFATAPSRTFAVGDDPVEMLIGAFSGRPERDVVTINARSDDLTLVAGPFGPSPTIQTIASGGIGPDAAIAFDSGRNGVLDLLVANGGDGRLALFQGGSDGLQLAGVIAQGGISSPTALAPAYLGGSGIDFLAAGAGSDAAMLLHFDVGVASDYLPSPSNSLAALGPGDDELLARLTPIDGSSLDLIAVFWAGSSEDDAPGSASSLRESSAVTTMYSPTEGQGEELPETPLESRAPALATPPPPPPGPDDEQGPWARVVYGLDEALGRARGLIEPLSHFDRAGDDPEGRPIETLARLGPNFGTGADLGFDRVAAGVLNGSDGPDEPGLVDEALRLFWTGGASGEPRSRSATAEPAEPAADLDSIDAPPIEVRLESVPLVSVAVAISARLILGTSPPRPSTFGKPRRSIVNQVHDPKAARPSRSL